MRDGLGRFVKGQPPHNKSGKMVKCVCGGEVWKEPSQGKRYCSRECYYNSKRGKTFRNGGSFKKGIIPWNKGLKSGRTKLRDAIENLQEYKNWRRLVFEANDYTCEICGRRGGKKEAHHKKQFKQIIIDNNIKTTEEALKCDELWEVDNGAVLCNPCHKLFRPQILWVSGQSGSGKTTFAKKIQELSHRTINLDGDEMRWCWDDLGFSKKDRVENNLRIAKLAKILKRQNFNVVISTICPYKELRQQVKDITGCKFIYLEGGKEGEEYPYESENS